MKFITLVIEDNSEIWGHHTGEIEGQPFDGVYPFNCVQGRL